MTYTIYEGFVLQTKRSLTALSDILHKAEEQHNASDLPSSRLYADMKSLSYQIFAATTHTLMVLAKLNNTPFPIVDSSKDVLYTYEEMHTRIDEALKALDATDKNYVVEHCEDVTPAPLGPNLQPFSGVAYAGIFQANIFFHVTTAYGILRKEAVPLGKKDYLLPFIMIQE
jgi:hypothetical protein